MDAAIDVGNTRTKVGVFEAGRLLEKQIISNDDPESISSTLSRWQIGDAIICATGDLFFAINDLPLKGNAYLLDHNMKLPFQNLYRTPETLGRDRIACVAGAWRRFPGEPSLVIDAGTCITYDFIDQHGAYHGGNISPGLHMRLRAMHAFTAALPDVSGLELPGSTAAGRSNTLIGRHTTEALVLGGSLGALYEVEGYIRLFQAENQRLNIILTGGDAVFFGERLKTKIFVLPDLVLTGLSGILQFQKNEYV